MYNTFLICNICNSKIPYLFFKEHLNLCNLSQSLNNKLYPKLQYSNKTVIYVIDKKIEDLKKNYYNITLEIKDLKKVEVFLKKKSDMSIYKKNNYILNLNKRLLFIKHKLNEIYNNYNYYINLKNNYYSINENNYNNEYINIKNSENKTENKKNNDFEKNNNEIISDNNIINNNLSESETVNNNKIVSYNNLEFKKNNNEIITNNNNIINNNNENYKKSNKDNIDSKYNQNNHINENENNNNLEHEKINNEIVSDNNIIINSNNNENKKKSYNIDSKYNENNINYIEKKLKQNKNTNKLEKTKINNNYLNNDRKNNEKFNDNKKNNKIVLYKKNKLILNNLNIFLKYDILYSHYLKNKTIALVGPAKSIIGTNKGNIIDNFDIIVRLNKSLPINRKLKKDIGSRTDVLYNSLNTTDCPGENNIDVNFFLSNKIKFLCCSYPLLPPFDKDIINYINKSKFKIPFRCLTNELFKDIENKINTRPFTGICAIIDLLQFDIKKLYITGLDFYNTSYYFNKNLVVSNIHNTNNQIKYLKIISLLDDRVIIDKVLEKVLYYDYYKILQYVFKLDLLVINNNSFNNIDHNNNCIIFNGSNQLNDLIEIDNFEINDYNEIFVFTYDKYNDSSVELINKSEIKINFKNTINEDEFNIMNFNKKSDICILKKNIKLISNIFDKYNISIKSFN